MEKIISTQYHKRDKQKSKMKHSIPALQIQIKFCLCAFLYFEIFLLRMHKDGKFPKKLHKVPLKGSFI